MNAKSGVSLVGEGNLESGIQGADKFILYLKAGRKSHFPLHSKDPKGPRGYTDRGAGLKLDVKCSISQLNAIF